MSRISISPYLELNEAGKKLFLYQCRELSKKYHPNKSLSTQIEQVIVHEAEQRERNESISSV